MGVTNFDYLPENQVRTTLEEARQVMKERKAAQLVSGANLRYFATETPAQYDWSGQMTAAGGQPGESLARFDITVLTETVINPLVDLAIDFYSSTDGITWTPYAYLDYWANVAPKVHWSYMRKVGAAVSVPKTSPWYMSVLAATNSYVAFKIQVVSTDNTSLSITRTY